MSTSCISLYLPIPNLWSSRTSNTVYMKLDIDVHILYNHVLYFRIALICIWLHIFENQLRLHAGHFFDVKFSTFKLERNWVKSTVQPGFLLLKIIYTSEVRNCEALTDLLDHFLRLKEKQTGC